MKNYKDSDCALNKFSEGIVSKFTDRIVEITPEAYLVENQTNHLDVSMNGLAEKMLWKLLRQNCKSFLKIYNFVPLHFLCFRHWVKGIIPSVLSPEH